MLLGRELSPGRQSWVSADGDKARGRTGPALGSVSCSRARRTREWAEAMTAGTHTTRPHWPPLLTRFSCSQLCGAGYPHAHPHPEAPEAQRGEAASPRLHSREGGCAVTGRTLPSTSSCLPEGRAAHEPGSPHFPGLRVRAAPPRGTKDTGHAALRVRPRPLRGGELEAPGSWGLCRQEAARGTGHAISVSSSPRPGDGGRPGRL